MVIEFKQEHDQFVVKFTPQAQALLSSKSGEVREVALSVLDAHVRKEHEHLWSDDRKAVLDAFTEALLGVPDFGFHAAPASDENFRFESACGDHLRHALQSANPIARQIANKATLAFTGAAEPGARQEAEIRSLPHYMHDWLVCANPLHRKLNATQIIRECRECGPGFSAVLTEFLGRHLRRPDGQKYAAETLHNISVAILARRTTGSDGRGNLQRFTTGLRDQLKDVDSSIMSRIDAMLDGIESAHLLAAEYCERSKTFPLPAFDYDPLPDIFQLLSWMRANNMDLRRQLKQEEVDVLLRKCFTRQQLENKKYIHLRQSWVDLNKWLASPSSP